MSGKWQNSELTLYNKIKNTLEDTLDDYTSRKRMNSVPFTLDEKFEEATN